MIRFILLIRCDLPRGPPPPRNLAPASILSNRRLIADCGTACLTGSGSAATLRPDFAAVARPSPGRRAHLDSRRFSARVCLAVLRWLYFRSKVRRGTLPSSSAFRQWILSSEPPPEVEQDYFDWELARPASATRSERASA